MTGNQLIAFVRSQLREKTYGKTWEDDDILYALNDAKDWIQMWVNLFESEYFYTSCTITASAGTQEYDLPDGVQYSAASKCNGTIDFVKQDDHDPVYRGDFRRFHDTSVVSNVIEEIDVKHKTLWIWPVPSGTFPFKLYYYYLLGDITASDTDIDFIPGCERFIAWIAIKNSKLLAQDSIQDVNQRVKEWQAVVRANLGSRIHGTARHFDWEDGVEETDYLLID